MSASDDAIHKSVRKYAGGPQTPATEDYGGTPPREREAFEAGRLTGFEEGINQAEYDARIEAKTLQWERLWQAFSLVFSFVPDAEEQRLVREHYETEP